MSDFSTIVLSGNMRDTGKSFDKKEGKKNFLTPLPHDGQAGPMGPGSTSLKGWEPLFAKYFLVSECPSPYTEMDEIGEKEIPP
jgi:hypothetical protein